MKIKWSKKAADSFESYIEYIANDKVEVAEKWALNVFERIESLLEFPNIGRKLKSKPNSDLKELILDKDFLVVYRIGKEFCHIISFRRTSQLKK